MKRSERFILCLSLCFFLGACAPATESATNLGQQIGQTISGEQTVVFHSNAWDIVTFLAREAFQIQPSYSHTTMKADNNGDKSLTLSAKPVTGTASTASTNVAEPISIDISCADLEGSVKVTLTPHPGGNTVARDTIAKIIARLDQSFDRVK